MPVAPAKFKPSVTPETWMRPYIACRMSTLLTAARFQCLDERFTNPSGTTYSKTQRTKVLRALVNAGLEHKGIALAEAKGFNRDDALYAYRKVFPWGKAEAFDPTAAELKNALREGFFVSISGNVDDVPNASPLDDHVNDVAHEIGLARLSSDEESVLVYEPMNPYKPIWVKWVDVLKFGSEFKSGSGRYFCIKVKIGWSTLAAAIRRLYVKRLDNVQKRLDEQKAKNQSLTGELTALQSEYDEVAADLASTEQLLTEALSRPVEWDDALDAVVEAVEGLRRA